MVVADFTENNYILEKSVCYILPLYVDRYCSAVKYVTRQILRYDSYCETIDHSTDSNTILKILYVAFCGKIVLNSDSSSKTV